MRTKLIKINLYNPLEKFYNTVKFAYVNPESIINIFSSNCGNQDCMEIEGRKYHYIVTLEEWNRIKKNFEIWE